MNVERPIILKLGGGAITHKDKLFSVDYESLRSIAEDIGKFLSERDHPLLIVHGGGSFGHPIAKKYLDSGGLSSEAFVEIEDAMRELNNIVVREFRRASIRAQSFQTSSHFITRRGEVYKMWVEPIIEALSRGIIPVLYGDVVIDISEGYSILSGDTIAALMIRELRSMKGYFATSVDGVYEDGYSKLVENLELRRGELDLNLGFGEVRGLDVTGGMYRKLVELSKYCPSGVEVVIFNGKTPGNVYKALKYGRPPKSTTIRILG